MEKYLIQTKDNNIETLIAKDIKEAICKLFCCYCSNNKQIQLFIKSLNGLDFPEEIIDLYNIFICLETDKIKNIFKINNIIYNEK